MAPAYYNEIDGYAAAWLRNLIGVGLIAPGDVDERSIVDVRPDDLAGYGQCHFFAGIGGWSYALRLAGWPDDRPVWTGSCPCQPFSAAGAGKAGDDERHLWPVWLPLIAQRRPAIVFGEQVEAAIGWGWLDLVFIDLEAEGYACGATVLPACCVGAPHIRNRLWFVADADRTGRETREFQRSTAGARPERAEQSGAPRGMADADGGDASAEGLQRGREHGQRSEDGSAGVLDNAADARHDHTRQHERRSPLAARPIEPSFAGELGHTAGNDQRRQGITEAGERRSVATGRSGSWRDLDWLPCTDGKARPVESGSFPLAHGIPARASKLRAYGNAIVPQVAAEFIAAWMSLAP